MRQSSGCDDDDFTGVERRLAAHKLGAGKEYGDGESTAPLF